MPGTDMMRVPLLVRIDRAIFVGLNDHTPQRIQALLAARVGVTVYAPAVPISLCAEVVDGLVAWRRRLPRPEDLQQVDAVFIQTGDAARDRAFAEMAQTSGTGVVIVEGQGIETRQPVSARIGPLTVIRQPLPPLRDVLRRGWRKMRMGYGSANSRDLA